MQIFISVDRLRLIISYNFDKHPVTSKLRVEPA